MAVKPLNIYSYFNKARFQQVGSQDCANWYNVDLPDTKSNRALYPAMGRRHVEFMGVVKLLFDAEPRFIFKSINYFYVVIETRVFQFDQFYNQIELPLPVSLTGDLYFQYLPVINNVYCMLTDGTDTFVITETPGVAVTMQQCTDPNMPKNPTYITVLGNRFIVSSKNTPTSNLTQIDLGGSPIATPDKWFTIPDGALGHALFFQATGIVGQLASINNQMYVFTDFSVDIWSNIPTRLLVQNVEQDFPFKLSSAYQWNVGISDPHSLAVDFGFMVWLARNRSGLVTFMMSDGRAPQSISTQAVNVLLESQVQTNGLSPFLSQKTRGFLYQWENTIFYRVIAGKFLSFGKLDLEDSSNALEYNFNTKKWHRVIELNGERNKISQHIYFNTKHLVIVETQSAIYEMRGDIYTNELQDETTPDIFKTLPFRYELITPQIWEQDYSEFITDYIEIDFVYGDRTFYKNDGPFLNTVFITDENGVFLVTENSDPSNPNFIIQEGTNFPTVLDKHYYSLFNPHVELYFSDDGGVTFNSADVREFSNLGVYTWRMRWYQLGASRNRVYKLVAVSMAPIVILSAVHDIRRASGGAN